MFLSLKGWNSMLTLLQTLNPDLKRFAIEGYSISIVTDQQSSYLVIGDVPYLNSSKELKHGTLISPLELSGQKTKTPTNHVVWFSGQSVGELPCDTTGLVLDLGIAPISASNINGVLVTHQFSKKPAKGYKDYYFKMTTYIGFILEPVARLFPEATPKQGKPYKEALESSFKFLDGKPRVLLNNDLTVTLKDYKIAIIGLGGTGSYVLDFVAKTPVKEIHLFDHDRFDNHNAFRAPGAPSVSQLEQGISKVQYFADLYSNMKIGLFPHSEMVSKDNLELLQNIDFVFICIDSGSSRKLIIEYLASQNIPFVDSTIGLSVIDDHLRGQVNTTLGSTNYYSQSLKHAVLNDLPKENEYDANIQIAELNALAACFAIIRWKQFLNYYQYEDKLLNSSYLVGKSKIFNSVAP